MEYEEILQSIKEKVIGLQIELDKTSMIKFQMARIKAIDVYKRQANYYMTRIGHIMGARIETDMRKDAFDHIQKLSDSYFNNTKVGQIMSRITNDLFDRCV